jgi:Zn-dependent protease
MSENPLWLTLLFTVPPLLIAVILHEIAHGWIALKLGDPTAKSLGRLTLNPIKHIDPFLTLMVPGFLILAGSPIIFGGAKPVPVDTRYFHNPRKGMLYVAIAGPITNFLLAALCYLLLSLFADIEPTFLNIVLINWLVYGLLINLVLAVFNLLPVPPLDGGRVVVGLLPKELAYKYARLERFGLIIVVALLYLGVVDFVLGPVIEFSFRLLGRISL